MITWTNVAHKMGYYKAFLHVNKTSYLRQYGKNLHICCCTASNNRAKKNNLTTIKYNNSFHRQFSVSSSKNIWTPNIWPFNSESDVPALPPGFKEPSLTTEPATVSIPDVVPVAESATNAISTDPVVAEAITSTIIDPPFTELGLASSWYPNHLVHQLLEFVHVSTDMSWWSTIVIGTLIIRFVSLPLYIYTRKYTIRFNNQKEKNEELTDKLSNAQLEGTFLQQMSAKKELTEFYKETKTGPFRGFIVNSSMSILFMTCIMAVRQMCSVPVPSMTEGGASWFIDLTSPDPYYILPTLTGAVIGLTINVGMKAGTMQGSSSYSTVFQKLQYLPIVAMPLIFGQMYSGVYLYIATTSAFTLVAQRLLIEPRVKEMLNFPEHIPPKKKRGTVRETVRERMDKNKKKSNLKMQKKIITRARKMREKERKKELKGQPPVTYTIGVDAIPTKPQAPDFEREWRPPKPKAFGQF